MRPETDTAVSWFETALARLLTTREYQRGELRDEEQPTPYPAD
jgi:hypothetical protein